MTINGQHVNFIEGATILEIATAAGIYIPTLCYKQGLPSAGGCGLCVVEDIDTGKIMPSCAARALKSLNLSSSSEKVIAMRKSALELLLSDHPADCEAPCQLACPSGLPVQKMLRLVAEREWDQAGKVARRYPFVCGDNFSRTPCELACRRSKLGGAVAIRAIHRLLCDDIAVEPTRKERSPHRFRSRMRGLRDEVMLELAEEKGPRVYSNEMPIDKETAVYEARRCLQCGCGKPDNCELRDLCGELGVRQDNSSGTPRQIFRESAPGGFRFDSSRCVLCGRCVRAARNLGVKIAPAFHGRGFDARIAPPLGRAWGDIDARTLAICAEVCPTGAMVARAGF